MGHLCERLVRITRVRHCPLHVDAPLATSCVQQMVPSRVIYSLLEGLLERELNSSHLAESIVLHDNVSIWGREEDRVLLNARSCLKAAK